MDLSATWHKRHQGRPWLVMPGEWHLHGSKGASSEFRLNWVVWETDLTPQAVNPSVGGSQ